MSSMKGKTFVITGGASGIGLECSKLLHTRGARVSIADVDQEALDATSAFFNRGDPVNTDDDRIFLSRVDVSKRDQVDGWIQETVNRWGKLDGAANLAGVIGKHHGLKKVEELEDDQWDLIMAVNLTGMMYSLRAELQSVKEMGSVVCATSVQGTMGFAKHAAYSASKHGVIGLARSAAKEVGERGVRVNCVAPGSINTPLMDKRHALFGLPPGSADFASVPINRMGKPEEVANLVVWLLSDDSAYVTGAVYAIDGGWAC